MGYYMTQGESKVVIRKENLAALHRGLKAMWKQPKIMGGGSSTGERWFSFCNCSNPDTDTLDELLNNMRWKPEYDAEGNIINLRFRGEKYGDEPTIFRVIAAVTEPGSYITMQGEDGCAWRWVFNDGKLTEEPCDGFLLEDGDDDY